MRNLAKWFSKPALLAVLLIFFSILAMLLTGLWYDLNKSEWAAWVQAIGATVGIAIAVWIPVKQNRDNEAGEDRRRKDEMRRICLAFRDEISQLRDNLGTTNVNRLMAIPDGDFFNWQVAVPKNRFPIFEAMVGRITNIDNDEIRRGIIELYESANTLMDCATLNNKLLLDYRELLRAPAVQRLEGTNMGERNVSLEGLRATCVTMQVQARRTLAAIDKVLPLLIRETQ